MGRISVPLSGWSTGFADFNNDGWKDLFVTCSHVNDLIEKFEAQKYKLHNAVFVQAPAGMFQDLSSTAGLNASTPKAHRGAAIADFNGDGKLDVAVSALNEPAELWENVSSSGGNWLILKLEGVKSNRDGIGARVRADKQHNQMTTSFGYASSTLQGVHFGLGVKAFVEEVEIRWPSGTIQKLQNVKANQTLAIREP